MARPSAETALRRIAVLGAASPGGARIRAALADRGVPGARVALYGVASEVAVLSEYDGEARLVQPVGELDAHSCAAVFVCEPGHDPEPLSRAAASGTVVVDLSGSVAGATTVAHPIAGALAAILAPFSTALGLRRASAFVLRPAADFGEAGMEELREQTVRLLRFEKTPSEVFGRQLAFNVIPDPLLPDDESSSTSRIVADTKRILGRGDVDRAERHRQRFDRLQEQIVVRHRPLRKNESADWSLNSKWKAGAFWHLAVSDARSSGKLAERNYMLIAQRQ
jgi:aspartate-semialdehyde dehydrogenase